MSHSDERERMIRAIDDYVLAGRSLVAKVAMSEESVSLVSDIASCINRIENVVSRLSKGEYDDD